MKKVHLHTHKQLGKEVYFSSFSDTRACCSLLTHQNPRVLVSWTLAGMRIQSIAVTVSHENPRRVLRLEWILCPRFCVVVPVLTPLGVQTLQPLTSAQSPPKYITELSESSSPVGEQRGKVSGVSAGRWAPGRSLGPLASLDQTWGTAAPQKQFLEDQEDPSCGKVQEHLFAFILVASSVWKNSCLFAATSKLSRTPVRFANVPAVASSQVRGFPFPAVLFCALPTPALDPGPLPP